MNITIFGAGAFGSALGSILEDNGHTVNYYDPIKYPGQSMVQVTENTDVNILATPSEAAPKLLLFISHDKPLINASKGFLNLNNFVSFGSNFSIISGGAFAADLMAKKETILTATSDTIVNIFGNNWLKFDRTTDNLGVLLCGTLKNIYAIGSGFWGLKYGTPDFDNFINAAIAEVRLILSANGADPNTINLACGLNDLVLTCASPTSRNYTFGFQLSKHPDYGKKILAQEIKPEETIEGLNAIQEIAKTPSFKIPDNVPTFTKIIDNVNNPTASTSKK